MLYCEIFDVPSKESLIKNAFVTFRSMEGAQKLIKAYDKSRCTLCLLKLLCECCSAKKLYNEKLFEGRFLKVEQAVEPSLILWEN